MISGTNNERKTVRKKIRRSVFLVFLVNLLVFAPTYALPASLIDKFAENNILFYDPDGDIGCSPSTITGDKVTIIGDSLSVGAQEEYKSQIPNADFLPKTYNGVTYELIQVSKTMATTSEDNYSGTEIARVLQEQGDLRPYLVFALGTNSPISDTDQAKEVIGELLSLVGTNHKVVLVTALATENTSRFNTMNGVIREAARNNNVAVADWAQEAGKAPERYISDSEYHVHLNATGTKLFVKLIKEALNSFAGGAGSSISAGHNRNYAGEQVWSDAELQAIEANRPFYEKAIENIGADFPWQLLAVIHSVESGLGRYNPSNGQGIYQNAGRTDYSPGPVSDAEFLRQTTEAAANVAYKFEFFGVSPSDSGGIKKVLFSYNGMAQNLIDKAIKMGFSEAEAKNGEGSYYVMNKYDAQRDPSSGQMSPFWPGVYLTDGVYTEGATINWFGTFVRYEALVGKSSSCLKHSGSIVETALLLSWDWRESHDMYDPKPEYVQAMKETGNYQKGNGVAPEGASCDQFVSTVMRYSGADPDFPTFGPGAQLSRMLSNPDMYMEVHADNDVANLEPGDIFVTVTNGAHIYIYLGEIDGLQMQAAASYNDSTAKHYPGVYFEDNYGREGDKIRPYRVFRRINY